MRDTGTPIIISHTHQFQELAMTENESDVARLPSATQFSMWKTNENGTVQHINMPRKSRASSLSHHHDRGICWFNPPDQKWSPSFYLSERGLDNVHIYLWITKDLCWVQSWLIPGFTIGGMACLYALFLTFRAAFWRKNIGEFWIKMAETMWLFSNFWWMVGELHDDHYGYFDDGDKSIVDKHTLEAGIIFICTLVWISLYYIILKPLHLLEETKEEQLQAINNDPTALLEPRFSFFFKTWSEYESVHVFFWVGKDTAWNWWIQSMWLVFLVPTLLIGFDFVYLTLRSRGLVIDHAHYFAQFMWVLANTVWAGGEFWITPDMDSAIPFTRFSSDARHTSRWYSSWVVLGAYLPLVAMYVLWFYYTWWGTIPTNKAEVESRGKEEEDGVIISSRHESEEGFGLTSTSSSMVVNPLVPVRKVNVQTSSTPPPPPSSALSLSSTAPNTKASFKVRASASGGGKGMDRDSQQKYYDDHDFTENTNGGDDFDHSHLELRMSDLSESNSVIHGAEI